MKLTYRGRAWIAFTFFSALGWAAFIAIVRSIALAVLKGMA